MSEKGVPELMQKMEWLKKCYSQRLQALIAEPSDLKWLVDILRVGTEDAEYECDQIQNLSEAPLERKPEVPGSCIPYAKRNQRVVCCTQNDEDYLVKLRNHHFEKTFIKVGKGSEFASVSVIKVYV